MAEVPLPTPTKVPVPSTDIRNAVFAGAKLDEEVTGTGDFYTDRLDVKRLTNTGRNNQFNAAQQERADQFQQFLLSAGYVFLGDYEDGPFQFSARNQYIRYNNQYYRLNATTDVGFTTSGTDATSFANDVTHFVLMDGDTLRQNLGSGDGLKWLGKCSSVVSLRAIEPTYDRQSITLHTVVPDGAIIDAVFFYDASDTTSADDGYRIIVTPGGARWVTDCADGIDIRLGGLLADGSNFGAAANKIIRGEVKKIVDSGTTFIRAVQVMRVPHPTYLSKNAYYTINEQIVIPSFMAFVGSGWIDLRTSLIDDCIVIRNEDFPGLTASMGGYIHAQGFSIFRNKSGKFRILGPGNTVSTGCGIAIGNTKSGDYVSVRDIFIADVEVRNFHVGLGFYGFDTYIITVERCDFVQNYYNVAGLGINKSNSGERILIRSCTIGNSRSHNIYWNLVGWNVTFDNISGDYAGQTFCALQMVQEDAFSD